MPRERRPAVLYEMEFSTGWENLAYGMKKGRKYRIDHGLQKKSTKTKAPAGKKAASTSPASSPKKKATKKKAATTKPPMKGVSPLSKAASLIAMKEHSKGEVKRIASLTREGILTHKWEYVGDAGTWLPYATSANAEVEKAYASWQVNPHVDVRAVKSGDWQYMVDFNLMQQQNIQHQNHKIRKIRRVPI